MTRRWVPAVALLLAAVVVWFAAASLWWRPAPRFDAVAANTALHEVQENWGRLATISYPTEAHFTVVTLSGEVVYSQGAPVTNELAAVSAGASTLAVIVNGERVGSLYWVDPAIDAAPRFRELSGWALTLGIIALTGCGLLILWWVDRRVLRPFSRLSAFADRVAAGDLNTPLPVERGNAFGAFTEAFDLMRDGLRQAREREAEVRESKRTLVAQLGHDIRTPLASIQSTAEVARLQSANEDQSARLDVITNKSAQINALLDDLFQANSEQLSVLNIDRIDQTTEELTRLIKAASPIDQTVELQLPETLVSVDPLRLQQVFDNVLSNSAKYAGTPVSVVGRLDGDYLCVRVIDRGPGVEPSEVSLMVGRGVRGSNSTNTQGSGLGLFTSAWLMDHMGGTLVTAVPEGGGFEVQLWLPLAGRVVGA